MKRTLSDRGSKSTGRIMDERGCARLNRQDKKSEKAYYCGWESFCDFCVLFFFY